MDAIRQRMGISSKIRVKVAANAAAAAEVLSALPQVQEAVLSGDQILVTIRDDEHANGLIARMLVNANFEVLSLVPEQLKLDDAFLQLTKGLVH